MIYLDHAATTPVYPEVIDAMYSTFHSTYGNPSSIHTFGRDARHQFDEARRYLASTINAKEHEVIFTSGGTEANNLAIIGTALENEHKGNHIITTAQEHQAILHIMQYLISRGFHVTYLPVYEDGKIRVDDLERTLTDNTILVSVMTANNETGVIQPIKKIAQLLKDHQAFFHTDAIQAYSFLDFDMKSNGIDLLSASAHKLNGPKGIGFLYVADHVPIQPMQYGGEQEWKKRPGTENVPGAVGFKKAAEITLKHKNENIEKYNKYKELFLTVLKEEEIEFQINGDYESSIPTILNISFPGTTVEPLLMNLDLEGVAASSGSACTAGSIEPSHVLRAMFGARSERIKNGIRFSFGTENTEENVREAAKRVAEVVKRLV